MKNETLQTELTMSLILTRLQTRVSKSNAKLLLDTSNNRIGVKVVDQSAVLEKEMAKTVCLGLINQGGPSFQVGQALYKEFLT
jgi:hypothetical protein